MNDATIMRWIKKVQKKQLNNFSVQKMNSCPFALISPEKKRGSRPFNHQKSNQTMYAAYIAKIHRCGIIIFFYGHHFYKLLDFNKKYTQNPAPSQQKSVFHIWSTCFIEKEAVAFCSRKRQENFNYILLITLFSPPSPPASCISIYVHVNKHKVCKSTEMDMT